MHCLTFPTGFLLRGRARCVALLVLLVATAVVAAATSTGPILFGQSCVLTGPNAFLGSRMAAGIGAAFLEANSNGGINGRNLSLITYDDGYNPDPALSNTQRLLDVDGVFALIGYVGTPTSVAALPAATSRGAPFIGAFTGSNGLRKPFSPYTVNLRASYDDETAAMAQLLVGRYSLRRIACFYQNDSFGLTGLSGITRALNAIKLPLASTGVYTRNTIDVAAGLENVAAVGNVQAVVMIGTYSALAAFVHLAKNDTRFTIGCRFISVSFVGSEALSAALSPADRSNVFVTQVVPSPTDTTSSRATASYRAAMQAFEGLSSVADFASFEGYLAGRFAAAVLSRMQSVTRSAMLSVIQQQSLFLVDDIAYGLYSGPCAAAAAAATLGCDCTQGGRRVWTTQLQTDGTWAQVDNNFQWGLSTCFSPTSLVVAPMSFVTAYPVNSTIGALVAAGIASAFAASNSRSIAAGRALVLQVRTYAANALSSQSEASRLNAALADVYASGVLGGVTSPATAALLSTPVMGRIDTSMSSAIADAYNAVRSVALGITNATVNPVLLLTPPLEEQLLALCHAAIAKWGPGIQLAVVATPENLAAATGLIATVMRATSFGMSPATVHALPLADMNVLAGTVVYLLSDDPVHITSVLSALRSGVIIGLLLPTLPSFTLATIIANSSVALPSAVSSQVLLARQFDDLAVSSSGNVSSTFLQTEFVLDATPSMKRNPAYQTGYLLGRFVAALIARNSGALQSADELLSSLYRSSTIAVDSLAFGPFQQPDAAARDAGCTSGLPSFPVQSFDGAWFYRYSRGAACTADYRAVPPPPAPWQFPNWGIAVISIACALALLVVSAVFGRKKYLYLHAPHAGPFGALFVSVKGLSSLTEQCPEGAKQALIELEKLVHTTARANSSYVAQRLHDGCFLIVATECTSLLNTGNALQEAMHEPRWLTYLSISDALTQRDLLSDGTDMKTVNSYSRRESVAQTVRSSAYVPPRSWAIGVGIAFNDGVVSYDEANVPLYNGAVVQAAALACDESQPGQILVTAAAREMVRDAVPDDHFTTPADRSCLQPNRAVINDEPEYIEYIPTGAVRTLIRRKTTKKLTRNADSTIDSVAVALEQAKSGLSRRRVAVLCVKLDKLNTLPQNTTAEGAANMTADVCELLATAASLQKGSLYSVCGGHGVLVFNAFRPAPNAVRRAVLTALTLRHWFAARGYGTLVSGLTVGDAYVGTAAIAGESPGETTNQRVMFGPIVGRATTLMRLCGLCPGGVTCLATNHAAADMSTSAMFQQIDRVHGNFENEERGVTDIFSVEHGRADATTDEEWMYDLDRGAETNPYAIIEKAVAAAMAQDTDDAAKLMESFNNAVELFQREADVWRCPPPPSAAGFDGAGGALHGDQVNVTAAGRTFVESLIEAGLSSSPYTSLLQDAWDLLRRTG